MRRTGDNAVCRATSIFSNSAIRLVLVCKTSGGIHDYAVGMSRFGGVQRVIQYRGGIAARLGLDDLHARARTPDFKLLNGGKRWKVSAAQSNTVLPSLRSAYASLPIVVVFPVPFTPTTITTSGSPFAGLPTREGVAFRMASNLFP